MGESMFQYNNQGLQNVIYVDVSDMNNYQEVSQLNQMQNTARFTSKVHQKQNSKGIEMTTRRQVMK